ncbi:MAG: alpha-1,2-fucosyltransferase [Nitrospirota bacterium]|nr:alpha-1,2-fucosyltransferase [Nitrospirota bacterium]
MFQYAAGRALALANGCQLKLDISGFNNYGLHNGYELELFDIKAEIASVAEVSQLVGLSPRIAKFVRERCGLGKKSYCLERNFCFDVGFFGNTPPLYLDGYWQSSKYFESCAAEIREEFTFSSDLLDKNLELARLIGQVNSVSIHIRRGDYVASQATSKVLGFVGLEYYKLAMRRIFNEVSAPWFFVFSDDLAWAKNNLGLSDRVTFVDHNRGATSYKDMRMMGLCQHHIIANSSFSWWAAWLNPSPVKIVIAPQRWFSSGDLDARDLLPDGWIKL